MTHPEQRQKIRGAGTRFQRVAMAPRAEPPEPRAWHAPCVVHATEHRPYQIGTLLPTLQLEELRFKRVSSGSCSAQTCAL